MLTKRWVSRVDLIGIDSPVQVLHKRALQTVSESKCINNNSCQDFNDSKPNHLTFLLNSAIVLTYFWWAATPVYLHGFRGDTIIPCTKPWVIMLISINCQTPIGHWWKSARFYFLVNVNGEGRRGGQVFITTFELLTDPDKHWSWFIHQLSTDNGDANLLTGC